MAGIAGILAGINGTVARLIIQAGLNVFQVTLLRTVGAWILLLAVCLIVDAGRLRVQRSEIVLLTILALVGYFGVPVLYLLAIGHAPVGIGVVLEYLAPVLVALWGRFAQHRHQPWQLWLAVSICLVGLIAITGPTQSTQVELVGVLAGLGAALALAAFYIIGETVAVKRDALSLTCWCYGVAALTSIAIQPRWKFPVPILDESAHHWPLWLLCLYVIVLGTVVPYLLLMGALRRLSATSVVMISLIEPVTAAICAWIVLSQRLSLLQIAGGACVLIGVLIAENARVRQG